MTTKGHGIFSSSGCTHHFFPENKFFGARYAYSRAPEVRMDGASYYLSAHVFVERILPYMRLLSTANVAYFYVLQGESFVETGNVSKMNVLFVVVERTRRLFHVFLGEQFHFDTSTAWH